MTTPVIPDATESLVWEVLPAAADVTHAAAAVIEHSAREALALRGNFRIVLAGGRTPIDVYRLLPAIETEWTKWEIFFGDERCLPATDPERNSRMVFDAWLAGVPVPPHRIHVIPVELGPDSAATRYAELIARYTPFDLVVLGVGEDGHTASLFPGLALNEAGWCLAVFDAPKPPATRVSLGAGALRATRDVLVIAVGASKQSAIHDWRAGRVLPITRVTAGLQGRVLVDAAAMGECAVSR
ncbi:MAG: 6-phosphogluconolactonase [Gammaproteobacteria bacterium]|nr:6-phosphogluconolactonase [Gammaproteobacteria bacterium]